MRSFLADFIHFLVHLAALNPFAFWWMRREIAVSLVAESSQTAGRQIAEHGKEEDELWVEST